MDFESGRNTGKTFFHFWAVDACKPSVNFDSMVSCVETAFRASAVPRYAESPMPPSRDWKGAVSTCAVPQSWVSCPADIAHFTVYTIQVGTEDRGNIFHGVTHGKFHRYHKFCP